MGKALKFTEDQKYFICEKRATDMKPVNIYLELKETFPELQIYDKELVMKEILVIVHHNRSTQRIIADMRTRMLKNVCGTPSIADPNKVLETLDEMMQTETRKNDKADTKIILDILTTARQYVKIIEEQKIAKDISYEAFIREINRIALKNRTIGNVTIVREDPDYTLGEASIHSKKSFAESKDV